MSDKVSLTDFADEIMLAVGDVPYEIAEAYARQSAISLCKRAHIVKRTEVMDLWAGVHEYALKQYDGEDIVAVHRIGRHTYNGQFRDVAMDSGIVAVELPDRLLLRHAPSIDLYDGLLLTVSTAPKQDACDVDRVIYDKYHEVVVNGAIARLLAQPAQTWSNPQASLVYEARAQRGIAAANADRVVGAIAGPMKLRHRRFV